MSKALKAAIEANDSEAVRKAVKGVKDINRKLSGTRAPLLYACEKGADKVLEALFEAGAIGEKRNTFPDDTPFAVAAKHRQFGVMKRLLALKKVSDDSIKNVLEMACMDGKAEIVEFILQHVQPRIGIELFRLSSASSNAPAVLKLLVKHGGDLRAKHDTNDAKGMTPLHELAATGKIAVIKTLIELGADVNARDGLGRTPLMVLAANLEGIEVSNVHAELLKPLVEKGAAKVHGEMPQVVDGLSVMQAMIESGADASLVDGSGNDAVDHCAFEYLRCDKEPDAKIIKTLRKAGAKSSGATIDLFSAIKMENPDAVRAAIRNGADINRRTPPPVPLTPLTSAAWSSSAESVELVRVLLHAGADPNKYDSYSAPLIRAARCGNLPVVKELIAAGADINAIEKQDEWPHNAYLAAETNNKFEVVDFLKSLGAGRPKPKKVDLLKPGVGSWNDFSELLVKAPVNEVAEALATMVKGKVQLNTYGLSFLPGKNAYVVVRPKGMDWCNIFQVAPPRLRFEDGKKIEKFAVELAKTTGASVLSIKYSDTSDAASILRVEPDGKKSQDQGWDRETLEEMVEAMGDEAPGWAKKQLAKTDEDEPSSTERLVMLAEQQKFVVAAFGFYCEPGRNLDVEVTRYGADSFDGVAFVTN